MSDTNSKGELIDKIYQFLCHEVENSNLSESAKESLTVASECIEQAYKLNRPQSERKPSNELLKIFVSGKKLQQTQSIYPNLFGAAAAASTTEPSAPQESTNPTPRVRKNITEEERKRAEELKNQGNELMKQDKHKEAYDSYTKAIDLDNNNAVYYSNRAAALSKMGDHNAALKDCLEAIEIDPSYSKAYGRMGLAYASMDDHAKAIEAYEKAMKLDPNNQSYQNNMKIAEEQLKNSGPGAMPNLGSMLGGLNTGGIDIASMLQNPDTIQTLMRRMQDPAMQNIINTVIGASANIFDPNRANQQAPAGNQQTPTNPQATANQQATQGQQQQETQQQQHQAASQNAATGETGAQPQPSLEMGNLLAAGQQIASALQASNPNFLQDITSMFGAPPPSNTDNSNQNPPPGYS